jgi:hypothetical protein
VSLRDVAARSDVSCRIASAASRSPIETCNRRS